MSQASYEIVRYRPQLRPQVVALLRHLVSTDAALNDAYFGWKHEQNPYTTEPVAYVALAGGAVAGMRAFLGARWHLGAGRAGASWLCACDLVIDPAHRGAKLFRRIMEFALADLRGRDAAPILNWSASPVTYGASLRSGWRLVAPYAPWSRRGARARIARALGERVRRWPLAWRFADVPAALAARRGFDALDAAWPRSAHAPGIVIGTEPRPDAMADLVCRTRPPLAGHVRDAAWYRWRFRNPLSEYRFLYRGAPVLDGFLVLQRARHGGATDVNLVDWQAQTPEILDAMVAAVADVGRHDPLCVWTATVPGSALATFRRCGFAASDDSRGDPEFRPGLLAIGAGGSDIAAAGANGASTLPRADRWDFRMAYSDFY
ncbi:MAG TPA: hypothetical protein VF059_13955 [Casimicrobiaceae bacterium]